MGGAPGTPKGGAMGPLSWQHFFIVFINFLTFSLHPEGGVNPHSLTVKIPCFYDRENEKNVKVKENQKEN